MFSVLASECGYGIVKLLGKKPQQYTDICNNLNLPKNYPAQYIKRLKKIGLIQRSTDPIYSGLVYKPYVLTQRGREIYNAILYFEKQIEDNEKLRAVYG